MNLKAKCVMNFYQKDKADAVLDIQFIVGAILPAEY